MLSTNSGFNLSGFIPLYVSDEIQFIFAKNVNGMKIHKKAVFWDNDGILVDTEKYYFEATSQILKKAGFELTKELYIDLFLIQAKLH